MEFLSAVLIFVLVLNGVFISISRGGGLCNVYLYIPMGSSGTGCELMFQK